MSRTILITDPFVVKAVAWSPLLINAGVFAATLSSALGSMMGAPRILQAFARDDILKGIKIFGQGRGKGNEPRLATILTFLIAQAGILLGDLNAIAPVITMFFMITYGTLNLACFYESITRNPSYRPKFRFSHWSTALGRRPWLPAGYVSDESIMGARGGVGDVGPVCLHQPLRNYFPLGGRHERGCF